MINRKIITVEEQTVKLIYPEQIITILAAGWGDYHVIIEEGSAKESTYHLMTAVMIYNNFDLDIKQY